MRNENVEKKKKKNSIITNKRDIDFKLSNTAVYAEAFQ